MRDLVIEQARQIRAQAMDFESETDPHRFEEKIEQFCELLHDTYSEALPHQLSQIANEIIPALQVTDVQVGGKIAILLGAMVEDDLDTRVVTPHIRDPFVRQFEKLREFLAIIDKEFDETNEESVSESDQENGMWVNNSLVPHERLRELWYQDRTLEQAYHAVQDWYLPVVALLKRDEVFGREMSQDQALVDLCDEMNYHGTGFVRELLKMLRDESILVIHPLTNQGYLVKPKGVTHNFQLTVLIADALVRGGGLFSKQGPKGGIKGKRPQASHVATMKNEAPENEQDFRGEGIWDSYTWRAIGADGKLRKEVPSDYWIWNEGIPSDIEPFEGQRVIILAPQSYKRSWNAGPSFDDLPASIELETILTPHEVTEWLQRFSKQAK